ncbi:hypothetical protein A3G67_02870 [Candidatus Roizmanbacteria bacterium RIFCSPLOWO2_12_FULL_40_12]|nr:MAG: hypothetical protein A2779_00400 [Candidatus Roizmanbacteria bacterium RIFCSPHIGHO2_01_FULL_40_98]OGK60552.1 MAG: hypothetical protein A3G67_02870 [Candidatus Roizmanbacteria bacterium RIFCSPLOWO2_12_FULL_40_12]
MTKRSLEIIVDVFYFSVVTVVVYGLTTSYFTRQSNQIYPHYLYVGLLLWEIIRINQYTLSVGALWNIWSHNLTNMFVGPLSIAEYLFSYMFSGLFKSIIVFVGISLMAKYLFQFDIFSLGWINLTTFYINLTIFSWTTGILILGLIFKYGTRIQSIAWGLVFIFQPLTASFFPVDALPPLLQKVAYFMPPTYVFEAARAGLTNPLVDWHSFWISLGLNVVYFALSIWYFNAMFNSSKMNGQFVKNES